jgi:hypothetical protein
MATTIDAKGDLVVGSGADAFVRVAVGSNNQVLTADSATTSGVKWATADALPSQTGNSGKYLTTDGTTASWANAAQQITWTARYSDTTFNYINRVAYNGSLYVAVGGDGNNSLCLTSPTGVTWTPRTSQFGSSAINAVVYDSTNSLWIIAGDSGKISTSPDGTTWTARTANFSTNAIKDLATNAGTTVAVGAGGGTTNTGGITYSTDGTTWTRKSQSLTVGATYNSVVYNGTNWVVGSSNSTNNHLYASTPSGTWTAGTTGVADNCYIIGWDGTRHITRETSSNNNTLRYSTSTTLGTTTEFLNVYTLDAANLDVKLRTNLYNSRIYTVAGLFYVDIGTTPTNTNFAYDISPRQFVPSYNGNGTPTVNSYQVFSTGRIMWTNGVLYTSF